ncbi:MAG: hypothetical protein GC183_16480 [Thiobacillus sp.]|nr:hypothetical protein [Thiobacillus sp.]
MRHLYALLVPVAALLLVGGCSSTPPSRFYTLSAATTPVAPSSGLSVAVGPVTVPSQVDRPQFVVSIGPNQVQLDEFNRWAAPLQDSIARVVAESLVAMLGSPHITLWPQTLSEDTEYRVAIEVQGFESAPGESASLDAVWTVRRMQDGKTETGRSTIREPVKERAYDALAAAHSSAIAHMSQDIADALRKLERVPVQKTDAEPARK